MRRGSTGEVQGSEAVTLCDAMMAGTCRNTLVKAPGYITSRVTLRSILWTSVNNKVLMLAHQL